MVLSFRSKLLAAMLLMVAGVTLTALLLTQRRVEANFQAMFRRQFSQQMAYLGALQDARLAAAKDQCLKFSHSVRLISLLSEVDISPPELEKVAQDELHMFQVLQPAADNMPGPDQALSGTQGIMVGFLDLHGRPLVDASDSPVARVLTALRRSVTNAEPQEVGYAALPRTPIQANGAPAPLANREQSANDVSTLYEVIFTKVVDPVDGRGLGAIVLVFPASEFASGSGSAQAQSVHTVSSSPDLTPNGLLLEGRLYADPQLIPIPVAQSIARQVINHASASVKLPADFAQELAGVPYRVFYDSLRQSRAFPKAYRVCLFPLAEQLQAQQELRWKILGSGAIAMVFALLLSLVLSQGLSGPIRDLVAGTAEIKAGNFLVTVPVRSGDELGKLAVAFNNMAAGLVEKEKYRSVLNMVCDQDVARELVDRHVALGGERREVSVLFCDIRGFSSLTLTMQAEEITQLLNEHMTALTRVVHDHQGVVDKFVGDCVMALFGAPKSWGHDALNAATCALEMIQARAALDQATGRCVSIGVGIATGEVIAGCMGSADRLNYTVLGERVNLAARLCSQAPAGQVFIDQATREGLADRITVQPSAPLTLKGWKEKVPAFRLLAVQAGHPAHEPAISHA